MIKEEGRREGRKEGEREGRRNCVCVCARARAEALKSLPDRSSAISQPLKVANPLAAGKLSLHIVSKEFVY